MSLKSILDKYRRESFSERDKGNRFEILMQRYLKTDPEFKPWNFKNIWLWSEFPYRDQFGGKDTGIDLVAKTEDGEYVAVQCKCYKEDAQINKPAVDTFLSTANMSGKDENGKKVSFSHGIWISTTDNFTPEADVTLDRQDPDKISVTRITLSKLEAAPIDWDKLDRGDSNARLNKKIPMPHQQEAISRTHEYFKSYDRGKLIMACGTGKTFTSLKIAENETKNKGTILFLVPSIALLSQTLREWTCESEKPINPVCICSDSSASKTEDSGDLSVSDLALPASTEVKGIIKQLTKIRENHKEGMIVVFSTYQSIDVISEAQRKMNAKEPESFVFDLVICDEAHRTTGIKLPGKDESAFTKVHDDKIIKAKKRLYMTATPRLYKDDVKDKAAEKDILLWSMNDKDVYGDEIYRIGFGEAVKNNLLSDYKVLVLTLPEKDAAEYGLEIDADDETRLVGCINALSKRAVTEVTADGKLVNELTITDPGFMRKAVAFCPKIDASKATGETINELCKVYREKLSDKERKEVVSVESCHVDGTMSAAKRSALLRWLNNSPENGNECRILTNVRCLSEGVDVPSLDAVLFLSAKNSQVDVVQSVGRVMRRAEGKKYGYIIIPVIIPSGVTPEDALNNNDRFKVVWTVLNALRAHDDRFNAEINKLSLNREHKAKDEEEKGGKDKRINVIGIPDDIGDNGNINETIEKQLLLNFDVLQDTVYAKMVQKVGNRHYWEQWAADIANIANRHIKHIEKVIKDNPKHAAEFDKFLEGLQKQLNPSITKEEAIEMLSQHLITRPVFEALFENYTFAKENPVSQSMQKIIDILDENKGAADEEQERTLGKFYESVQESVEGIENAAGRQKVILELYDKFFKTALPLTVEKLGIVYTPVEVVDFIINSVADVLKKEFGRTLSEENVHILDPFTGTGTFITRLLQSGHIKPEDMRRKYQKEIHANEIVLLAYYIASINIENTYHGLLGAKSDKYESFNGICLTDTFQTSEYDESLQLSDVFPQNSERVEKQKKCPLTVILGNPPYSVGQKSENDNAKNQKYEKLDGRVAETYAKYSIANNKKSLYDSYIKAFRWASDRLNANPNGGVIGFITNSGWIDKGGMDGFRQCLEEEFTSIYVFNLRGSIRAKNGDLAKREGENVFNIMTGVAVTILVKNPTQKNKKATIYYRDIGDYLSRKDKFEVMNKIKSVLSKEFDPEMLKPNEHNDWINQRSDLFKKFLPIGDKDNKDDTIQKIFDLYSNGVVTSRDSWVYNYSINALKKNIKRTIAFYNKQVELYKETKKKNPAVKLENVISFDEPTEISWSSSLLPQVEKENKIKFNEQAIVESMYRPFCKQFLYIGEKLIHRRAHWDEIFPTQKYENLCICVTGIGARKDFSILITDKIADFSVVESSQCFPLYWYEEKEDPNKKQGTLFDSDSPQDEYIRHDGITDFALQIAREKYGHKTTKEDIFYYIYGLLHSLDYKTKFAADLKKMLPRIPFVDSTEDFDAFRKAGRKLADLHLNYENQKPLSCVKVTGKENKNFKVDKIRFKSKEDKSEIMFNSSISITGIPKEAHDYSVNGRTPIEWIMDRYQVKTDKDSQITNDPNDWAAEHENPRYILDLLLSVITVSVETVKIIASLPKIDFKKLKA